MNEIKTNDELIPGKYYHCFCRKTGRHSIHECFRDGDDPKYIGKNHIWADDDNNQALERWRMFEVMIPLLTTINLCNKHNGNGFQSDCVICNKDK